MFKFIKRVREEMKKEAELHSAMKRLARVPFDYELLQTIVDVTTNSIAPVEIDVTLLDGTRVSVKPSDRKPTDFVSFKQRYNERNK